MLTVETANKWLALFADKIIENKSYLSELDTPIGDGDHGSNMARGVQAMKEALAAKEPDTVADVFKVTAMALMSKVGGASGPLYGTAFMEMAKVGKETPEAAQLVAAAFEGIKRRGGAEVGDKTMLDVWGPVVSALAEQQLTETLIEEAVAATKPMQAKKGRASYVGERSIGHLDPGAVSSGYLFQSMLAAGV